MSLKKNSFLIFISFFPVFIFRSNLNSIEVFISLIIFLILPLLLDYFISIRLKPENKYNNLYLASIFTYGIDNHLGLWNGVIQPLRYFLFNFFEIIYIPGVIFFTLLIVIIYLFISINNANFYKVVLIFLCTISIFNIFDQTKRLLIL